MQTFPNNSNVNVRSSLATSQIQSLLADKLLQGAKLSAQETQFPKDTSTTPNRSRISFSDADHEKSSTGYGITTSKNAPRTSISSSTRELPSYYTMNPLEKNNERPTTQIGNRSNVSPILHTKSSLERRKFEKSNPLWSVDFAAYLQIGLICLFVVIFVMIVSKISNKKKFCEGIFHLLHDKFILFD